MDYEDLNKYIQKDHFLLPFISFIIDNVASHNLYNFMDAYFNNIKYL